MSHFDLGWILLKIPSMKSFCWIGSKLRLVKNNAMGAILIKDPLLYFPWFKVIILVYILSQSSALIYLCLRDFSSTLRPLEQVMPISKGSLSHHLTNYLPTWFKIYCFWVSNSRAGSKVARPDSKWYASSLSSVYWPSLRLKVPPPGIYMAILIFCYLTQAHLAKFYLGTRRKRRGRLR
jgi:hypothetical protein